MPYVNLFQERILIRFFLENVSQKNIGLLSIDIDGNDYWVWKAITTIDPSIVVIEYNSILGVAKTIQFLTVKILKEIKLIILIYIMEHLYLL